MLIQQNHPGTFLERGAAVPFTTPALIGTRARPAAESGIELIMPNPSGARGSYLFSWGDLGAFCQPTLHDLALSDRVNGLLVITPHTIRRTANEVAAEGFAGRAVAEAAKAALQNQQQCALATNFALLKALLRQIEPPLAGAGSAAPEDPSRAKQLIAKFAPQLGLDGTQVANMLEELASIFLRVGVGETAPAAHLPLVIGELREFIADLRRWAAQRDAPSSEVARQIADQAELTLRMAEQLVAALHHRARDVVQLLRDRLAAKGALAAEIARPDWLLDGWEQICLRWRATPAEMGETVLAELAAMLPAIPDEASDWGLDASDDFDRSWLRKVRAGYDWRSGLIAFQAVERGEKVLELGYARGLG